MKDEQTDEATLPEDIGQEPMPPFDVVGYLAGLMGECM